MFRVHSARRLAVLALLAIVACRAGEGAERSTSVHPLAVPHRPRPRTYDVTDYRIALELLPEERAIRAECTVRLAPLEPLEHIDLDLVGLTVDGVEDEGGHALRFRRQDGILSVDPGRRLAVAEPYALHVRYGGRPERGLWFTGRRDDGSGPTMVFSHGQTEGSRGWFPCFDQPDERAASEIVVTAPASWTIVAAGERVESHVEGERRTERWRMDFPHPSYLVDLVAGELTLEEGRAGTVPLEFLAEPCFSDWIAPTFEETDEVLAFLADLAGLAYPYPKYSQACVDNFPWGGMENISATTLTPLLLTDELGRRDQPPFGLIAHEAAHQWFGDLFTCADWSQLWLNEGFATYLTLLYMERTRGVDEFRAQLRETQEAYLAEEEGPRRRPIVSNVWKEPDDVFDTHPYQGAAARLHLLRCMLGDEHFREGVRLYAREHVGRSVVTDDLRSALERASGEDLRAFFEQWFLSPGFPEFGVGWSWDPQGHRVLYEVEQIQDTRDGTPSVFEVPVDIELRDSAGARTEHVRLDERRERFVFTAPERPLYVRFDAHDAIPKRVREEKEAEEWLALARLSDDVNARREGLLVCGRLARVARERGRGSEALIEALTAALAGDPSPWARADAATALGEAGGDAAEAALRRAATEDEAPRARAAALRALALLGPDGERARLAEGLFYDGPSWQVRGAAAALLSAAAPERAFEFLASALDLVTPHDVLAGQLLGILAQLPDPRVPAELRRRASDASLEPTARAAAVAGLQSVARERLENSRFVAGLLGEESFHLRLASLRALVAFGDAGAIRALRDYYPRSRTSAERRVIEGGLERRDP